MSETIKIILNTPKDKAKDSKSKQKIQLEGYVEVEDKYLKFLIKSWIKYMNKDSLQVYSGGFLSEISDSAVYLRDIKGNVKELQIENNLFFCKGDSQQYSIIREILSEYEKLEFEKRKLQEAKRKFYLQQNKLK